MRMFHHKVGDFPYTISVILYSKKDYKSLHRRNMTDISDDELSSIRGYSYLDNKYITVYLGINLDLEVTPYTIIHEAAHSIHSALQQCSVDCNSNDEPFCYALENLVEVICKKLKIKFIVPKKYKHEKKNKTDS